MEDLLPVRSMPMRIFTSMKRQCYTQITVAGKICDALSEMKQPIALVPLNGPWTRKQSLATAIYYLHLDKMTIDSIYGKGKIKREKNKDVLRYTCPRFVVKKVHFDLTIKIKAASDSPDSPGTPNFIVQINLYQRDSIYKTTAHLGISCGNDREDEGTDEDVDGSETARFLKSAPIEIPRHFKKN